VFTARYALSPYIKQIRFVFKRLIEEYSLRVFKNRVLRRIRVSGSNREEVTGSSRTLHNEEELRDWYSLANIIRVFNSKQSQGSGMWNVRERREMGTGFSWENLWERDTTWKT
jgi:hypothetical protein